MKKLFLMFAICFMMIACNSNVNTETVEEPITDSTEIVIDSIDTVENDSIIDFEEVIDSIIENTIVE